MNIFVPFTHLRAETYDACPQVFTAFVPLLNHEKDYGHYWSERWKAGDTFINVEQDVVPPPGLLLEMWNCREPYCRANYCYPWAGSPIDVSPIGCAKFSSSFIADHPIVFAGVHWHEPQYLILNTTLNKAHVHEPAAMHLHVHDGWPLDARRRYETP